MTSFGYLVRSSSAYCFSSSYTHQDITPLASSEYAVVLPEGASLELVSWGQTLSTGCCANLCNCQWSGVGHTDCKSPGHARKGISRARQTSHCQQEWCMQLWHLPDVLLLRTWPMCSSDIVISANIKMQPAMRS